MLAVPHLPEQGAAPGSGPPALVPVLSRPEAGPAVQAPLASRVFGKARFAFTAHCRASGNLRTHPL